MKKRIQLMAFAMTLVMSHMLYAGAENVYAGTADKAGYAGEDAAGPDWRDYNGKRIGVMPGTPMEKVAAEYFPDSTYVYLNGYPDCNAALLAGKIDAYLGDEPGLKTMEREQPRITYIRDRITDQDYSFAFRKNDPASAALCDELNDFIDKISSDGTMEEMDDIWFGTDEGKKVVDMSDLTGEKGKIKVITTSTDMPWSYIKDGKNVGYDIDLVVRFCRDRGYALEIGDVDFGARIAAVRSGKYDFSTDMNVTAERAEQVLFSKPTANGGIVLAILAKDPAGKSFIMDMADSFKRTFIREARWKMFASGIGTTVLITILSIVFGTLLGFGTFMACRKGNPVANLITRFAVRLVEGMPIVVLLMILYYLVFKDVDISGTVVAVIGFTLVFGAGVYGQLCVGVDAVDKGQMEGALALGYDDGRAFRRIILPQAIPHVLPVYRGEAVALIKATAIVGYIAVQDLTRMGDLVRARTYEAFFPLIAVAVVYFILAGIITSVIKAVTGSFDKNKRRSRLLKGVSGPSCKTCSSYGNIDRHTENSGECTFQ